MVLAGYVVELVFTPLGLVPTERNATVLEAGISWNYTTYLNIAFLALAALLVWRFVRTGGRPMLTMMGGSPDADHAATRATCRARPRGHVSHVAGWTSEQSRGHHGALVRVADSNRSLGGRGGPGQTANAAGAWAPTASVVVR